MKITHKITLAILFSFTLSSCRLTTINTRYIIENKTDYTMNIEAYYDSQLLDKITINPNNAFVKEAIFSGENSESSLFDKRLNPRIGVWRDSVVIIFDNQRVLIQYCESLKNTAMCGIGSRDVIEKNLAYIILDSRNRVDEKVTKKGFKKRTGPFVITFDNSDYERAIKI